jgi:glycosyltransferase involved in cell wall biosynthesis
LIRAAAELEGVNLHIPSDGPLTDELRRMTEKLGVDVEFHGRVTDEELVDLYRRADLFCLPSKNEGLPLAMLEALSCGTPVLVSDTGDNRRIVKESGAGKALKNTDASTIQEEIESMRNGDLRKMSKNARNYAEQNLDWIRIARRYEEVYRSVHR